jgi:hypothetical protein
MAKEQGVQVGSNPDDIAEKKLTKEIKGESLTPGEEMVDIVFTKNRRYELKVGRKIVVFEGRELKKIPKSWLDHPDFIQAQSGKKGKKFIVKGVRSVRN